MMRISGSAIAVLVAVCCLASGAPLFAQTAQKPVSPSSMATPSYQAAMQLYQKGRNLESAGRQTDAERSYNSSLVMVEKLLVLNPSNADLISLQCWNLFRLGRHKEVVVKAQKILQTIKDYRIVETMGESLYFLDQNEEALKAFASYIDQAPADDERISSAYYYMGECHIRLKQYEHADIAFSAAVTLEKGMYYWWYRLGWVKEMLGQYRKSYEAYGKALALNPNFQFAKDGRLRVKAKADL
ncbi:MAG: tetratricopeptide repeat protein [Spirochaetaceae bacterium]|nr:tetratricopeptide repeat protein [Spirochaetaceae bacterium]